MISRANCVDERFDYGAAHSMARRSGRRSATLDHDETRVGPRELTDARLFRGMQ
jgi:hypothetical protein